MKRAAAIARYACLLALLACDQLPGKPTEADRYVHPLDVVDFETLYATNCSGCHGANGKLGPAQPLGDPVYLAFAPDAVLRSKIHAGVDGTSMPAFGLTAGGPLSDQQIDALVAGLRTTWGGRPPGNVPSYEAEFAGDWGAGAAERGTRAFERYCGDCHGPDGRGDAEAGSVVDPSYLGLRSDQGLRTTVVAGRPDLEMPDWRSYIPGRVMSAQEISDVVGWLIAQRPEHPGQPYPTATDPRGSR
jgi:mono/diheme cytochrome c family protein